mmetsp:Transcript_14761/g.21084  ORF Transcript_14761/g.21084 Transcript_14761/m.21084 type:complete len:108 (+) Transcript_14761:112-435(+)
MKVILGTLDISQIQGDIPTNSDTHSFQLHSSKVVCSYIICQFNPCPQNECPYKPIRNITCHGRCSIHKTLNLSSNPPPPPQLQIPETNPGSPPIPPQNSITQSDEWC